MSATPARAAEQHLPYPGLPVPPARSRRATAGAAAGVAAVAAHLILAPAVLALTGAAVVTGRLTRWRPLWLTVPAAGGAAWTAAAGLPRALAGLAAGPRRLLAYLAGVPGHPAHLRDSGTALAQAVHQLPGQLPAGLLIAAAEAAALAWLAARRRPGWPGPGRAGSGRPGSGPAWRPGLLAVIRRHLSGSSLAAGHHATRTGFGLGLDPASGRLAELSWATAAGGVLVTGAGIDAAVRLGFPAASAAIARRKTMVVIDLTASDWLAGELSAACRAAAAPLTEFRPVPPGRWAPARPGGRRDGRAPASTRLAPAIRQALRDREVVLTRLDPAMPGPAAAVAGDRAVGALAAVLGSLREQGLRGDCLAWVHGCEGARPPSLARLLELGAGTGTAILLSTASAGPAAALAGQVAAVVAGGPADARVADGLAAWNLPGPDVAGAGAAGTAAARAEQAARLRRQPAGEFTVADRQAGIRTGCRPVPRRPAARRPAARRRQHQVRQHQVRQHGRGTHDGR